jgi:hypothetical protein
LSIPFKFPRNVFEEGKWTEMWGSWVRKTAVAYNRKNRERCALKSIINCNYITNASLATSHNPIDFKLF